TKVHSLWVTILDEVVLILLQFVLATVIALAHRIYPLFRRWFVHHMTVQERQLLAQLGKEAYVFAETTLAGRPGQEKLEAALRYATSVANRHGLALTPDELRAAIEQAVLLSKKL
ncbi:MAG: phage holin family protein, partial [Alicyclobacillus sp.]|nr:phage holin family protein [Alicyclobacillus sp.]